MSKPCANCGDQLPEGARVCDNCGMPVSQPAPPQEEAAPPQTTLIQRQEAPKPLPTPTAGRPAFDLTSPHEEAPTAQRRTPASPPRRDGWWSGRGALILGGLVATLLGVGIAAWILLPQLRGGEEVPSLEGQTLAAARQEVGDDFELIGTEEGSGEPKGTIISQDPEPGAKARRGGEISVVVSAGTETIALPNVIGMPQGEAEQALRSEGFRVRTQPRESSEEDAGRVVDQSPSGNEAEKGSEVALAVGEAPREEAPPPEEASEPPAPKTDYASITDNAGALRVEVPRDWSDVVGEPWMFRGKEVGPGILAAPDVDAWTTFDSAPGLLFGASSTLVGQYDDEEILDLWYSEIADGCEYAGRELYDRGDFTGYKDVWTNCGGAGTRVVQVVAAPEDRSFLLTVQVGLTSEMDPEIEEHILGSFEVVGAV